MSVFVPPRSVFVPRFRLSRLDEERLDLLSPREQAEVVAMLPFATPMLGGSPFAGFSATYTAVGTSTVAIPAGATRAFLEGYGGGGFGSSDSGSGAAQYYGGCGGNYANATVSVSGLTGLYLSVPNGAANSSSSTGGSAVVRQNSSSGTVLMSAGGGKPTVTSSTQTYVANVGDVSYKGGQGSGNASTKGGGGGAAGPNGAGGNATSVTVGGVGGGGLAGSGGAGGTTPVAGNNYGGGGGYQTGGAQGAIKITWS